MWREPIKIGSHRRRRCWSNLEIRHLRSPEGSANCHRERCYSLSWLATLSCNLRRFTYHPADRLGHRPVRLADRSHHLAVSVSPYREIRRKIQTVATVVTTAAAIATAVTATRVVVAAAAAPGEASATTSSACAF